MNHVYTLIAIKEESADYCRGCLMESYSGDHQIFYGPDREKLTDRWAALMDKNNHLERAESGYEFSLFIDGVPGNYIEGEECCSDADWTEFDDKKFHSQVEYQAIKQLAEDKLAAIEAKRAAEQAAAAEKAAQAKAAADRRAAEAKEAAERAEFERLQAKYGYQR